MYIWLTLALIFASLETLAVWKNLHGLEYLAKPAVMVYLFLWLYFSTGLRENRFWFGAGILFSLAGDVLLMNSLDGMFLYGLMAFLFAHIFYIVGFREELVRISVGSLALIVFIVISITRIIRRIVDAMRAKEENRLINPVIVYTVVISVMLYSALSTLYDPTWKMNAALLVGTGAFLFCTSDVILAWNKFVSPIKNGRVWNIAIYHLGQIGLIAGVISQFR